MDFEQNLPEWGAEGTEPPASLKEKGFEAGYKPPAAYFNWFWNRVCACLKEIRQKLNQVFAVKDGGTGRNSVTSGSYLVGNGTDALTEKTPEEVRKHIRAAEWNLPIPVVPATSEDGVAFAATVEGVTELINGMIITIVPERNSASTTPTLDINGLGVKMIRLPLSFNNAAMSMPKMETYISEGRPLTLQYDAAYLADDGIWKVFGKQKTSAQDLYGTVPIESGGTGATDAAAARTALGITPSNIGASSTDHTHSGLSPKSCSNTDFNTLKDSGWYYGYTEMTNAAFQGICVLEVIAYSGDWIVQRQTNIASSGNSEAYERIRYSGTKWSAWTKIAKKAAFTATLSTSDWSSSAPYTQTVTISGILASDNPVVDLNMSSATTSNAADLQEAWACVGRIVTAANQITAYCYEDKPTVALPLNILVVR